MYLACPTKIAAGVGCAAILLAGGDAPLSVAAAVASDDCTALTQTPSRRRGWTGARPLSLATRTPQNLRVFCRTSYNKEELPYLFAYWDIASAFPRSLLTGHCARTTHESGRQMEWCYEPGRPLTDVHYAITACFNITSGERKGELDCPGGAFEMRIRLTTRCNVNLPWSPPASCTY